LKPTDGDAKRVVRRGYDAAAESYLADRPRAADDVAALTELTSRLGTGGSVLDLGCGAGLPVTDHLLGAGYLVVGLDFSMAQLRLARQRGMSAPLTQADMSALPFRAASFDGLAAYYSIIHVPREEHTTIVDEIRRVLVPGGHALLVFGSRDLPADHDQNSWFGVPMYWSHYDAETSLALLSDAGLKVEWSEILTDPMGHGEHLFALVTSR
jgi:ubiquinone/menaquinone biosynthesis C-methylase UbiE